jgi:hypothetical protein
MIDNESPDNEFAIQDRALVEAETNGRPVSFPTVIVRICPGELWLGLASPDRRLETIAPNQTVRLTVAREGAALLAQTVFLRHLGGSRSRVFAVAPPLALERVERRNHVRYPVNMPIRFRPIDPATWEPCGKPLTTVTKNLSPGGLLFVSEATVEVGDDLDLILSLSGLNRLSMSGVVKRLGRLACEGDGQVGHPDRPGQAEVAVKFTRITSLDQDRIARLILLTEHQRREAARRAPNRTALELAATSLPVG